MISSILSWLASLIINFISSTGYLGVAVLSALESACIPVPSEVIVPFSGYLVSAGRFSFLAVALWATLGNLVGSLAAYFVGYWGGRPFIRQWGKYIFLRQEEIDNADKWFLRYGSIAVFFSRLLPIVRTFISLPAGIGRMRLSKFITFTFLGSLPWNFGLAYIGLKLGENWKSLEQYFRKFDYALLIILMIGVAWWAKNHLLKNKVKKL